MEPRCQRRKGLNRARLSRQALKERRQPDYLRRRTQLRVPCPLRDIQCCYIDSVDP